jgi:hypothetical protein
MKTLDEKKLLVKMAKAFGQPVDEELINSIRREEELEAVFFGKKETQENIIAQEKIQTEPIIEQPEPSPPEPAFTPPVSSTVNQTLNYLNTVTTPSVVSTMANKEIEGIKKTIAEMMQKVSTLSWGGGGTGIVRLYDADDFDRVSIEDDKQFVTWRNGYFQLDYINPNEIIANTVLVTSNSYQITNDDYYIGVNVASTVTITLPLSDEVYTGREFYIKDESGNAGAPARFIDIYPSGSDKIDNQNYVRLQIDNGGLKFIYRNGWRVI